MPGRLPPSPDQVRDLELLLKAHHPLLYIETVEEDRVTALLEYVADRLSLPLFGWSAHRGLVNVRTDVPVTGTEDPGKCLDYVHRSGVEALFHLRGFSPQLGEPPVVARLKDIYRALFEHRGAIVLTAAEIELPPGLDPLFTVVDLAPPSDRDLYDFVRAIIRDVRQRMPVEVELSSSDVSVLLGHLRGLTLFEIKKVLTQTLVEDGRLARKDILDVLEAKRRIVTRSGVLDYFPADQSMAEVAGLRDLKAWLAKRKAAFEDPVRAKEFGLMAPKGVFLLGVQGCGKSLSAKAIAHEWGLPLVRLDPSKLYNKYFGESEKNLRRAIRTAEAMAPVVLWIDEIEKAFGAGGGRDDGPTRRIFGSFLTWLNEKKETVFVVATANDVANLPPELLRKGRFDELFFVDLPTAEIRARIFALHVKRAREPESFRLEELAAATEGFSGAEIEQVVLSALYTAFSEGQDLSTELLLREIRATRPLSVTMDAKLAELRAWARERAVSAG